MSAPEEKPGQKAMSNHSERSTGPLPRREQATTSLDSLACWEFEESGKGVRDTEKLYRDQTLGWGTGIAREPLVPAKAIRRPLRPGKERWRRVWAELIGKADLDFYPLVAQELHASAAMLSAIPVTPEHGERADDERMQQLEEEYHRFVQRKPRLLSEAEREAIRHLATDIPALWATPTTMAEDRKEIICQIVERVVVDVQGGSERVRVRIEWIGGGHTEGVVIRPIGKLSELSTYPQICHQVQELTEAGWAATAIAQALNGAGFRPSRSSTGFRAQTITQLQHQLGMRAPRPRVRHHDGLLPGEWWPTELVRTLGIPRGSLYHWIRQGLVRARQLDEPLHRWVVWADEAEQERLREYHQRAIGDDFRHRWADTPLAEQR